MEVSDVGAGGVVVVESLHRSLAVIASKVLETALRSVVVPVTLDLTGQDVPPPGEAAPVVAVHLDGDVRLAGGIGAHRPHVQVDCGG